MKLRIYQVDAFADKPFGGNPAAVVPLQQWLPDSVMQSIAMENNLSETAFFVPGGDGYHLRWFTPNREVDLCGHATLATAYVIFNELGYKDDLITFTTKSGPLRVARKGELLELDFPVWNFEQIEKDKRITKALGQKPSLLYKGTYWVAFLADEAAVRDLEPQMGYIKALTEAEGLVVTAPGTSHDFVSRFFMPNYGIDEDPVTGSAHCILTPIWSDITGKTEFKAKQVSARGGDLTCALKNDRVHIAGTACLYMRGEITI